MFYKEYFQSQDYVETPPPSDEEDKSGPEEEGKFSRFRISEDTVSLLKKKKILYLFPVQIKTFDSVYDGLDVVVQASKHVHVWFAFNQLYP